MFRWRIGPHRASWSIGVADRNGKEQINGYGMERVCLGVEEKASEGNGFGLKGNRAVGGGVKTVV